MKSEKTYELVLLALFTAIIVIMAFTPLGYIPLVVINATIIHIPVILGALFLGPKKGAFLGFVFGFTSFINNTFKAITASAFVFSPVLAANLIGVSGIFKSLYICFVPRILVGVIPYFAYILIQKLLKSERKIWPVVIHGMVSFILFVSLRAFICNLINSHAGQITGMVVGLALSIFLFIVLTLTSRKKTVTGISLAYAGIAGAFTNTLFVMSGIYILYKDAYAQALGIAGDTVINVIMGIISFNGIVEAAVAAILIVGVGMALLQVKPISTERTSKRKRASQTSLL
ncbi:ECF transporter S component [Parablautia muri]|uniref:ECF transporter S component n=1 Tax=Parablautia muri TaxID=2320879 RepID=A0A9X5BJW8_9FIRM|nr:ECF transporter S component [Parablautia muri]NBJ95083.1 ECF transporter S component [Parablautia muri]